jgi:hypothetical protein
MTQEYACPAACNRAAQAPGPSYRAAPWAGQRLASAAADSS